MNKGNSEVIVSPPCQEIIEDIEDLIAAQEITPKERYSSRKNVKVKVKNVRKNRCIFKTECYVDEQL
jgi:hypothetical protein